MFWNLQKAVVKTFGRFAYEISMVLESAGGVHQATLQFHCLMHKTAVGIEIMMTAVGVEDKFYL